MSTRSGSPSGAYDGFNGAATLQPRKFFPRGRRQTLLTDVASMGPRLFSRGNGIEHGLCNSSTRIRASMGPRLFSRGNISCTRGRYRPRDRLHGAALKPRKCAGPLGSKPGSVSGRFNGAATLQPRKLGMGRVDLPGACRFNGAATLQPRKSGRRPASNLRHLRSRFNGAATLQPRKSTRRPFPLVVAK